MRRRRCFSFRPRRSRSRSRSKKARDKARSLARRKEREAKEKRKSEKRAEKRAHEAANAGAWTIYVSGIPTELSYTALHNLFSKVGLRTLAHRTWP